MSARKATRSPKALSPDLDETSRRLMAYLASMGPLRGCVHDEPHYQMGRAAIERMAMMAMGTDYPPATLTAAQCADVLHFIRMSEPLQPLGWWDDPEDAPSHLVGFVIVLCVLEKSLRAGTRARGGAK